jgi:hypothetical protein
MVRKIARLRWSDSTDQRTRGEHRKTAGEPGGPPACHDIARRACLRLETARRNYRSSLPSFRICAYDVRMPT